jgi:SAM-dependent MidA family methyltransferase
MQNAFLSRFQTAAAARGALSFEAFMALALYDPGVGYYSQKRVRVGRSPDADFYTASSMGATFGALVSACCQQLLRRAGYDPSEALWVEVGSEDAEGVLKGVETPFRQRRAGGVGTGIDAGQMIEDLARQCETPIIVFSNELFDAQPVSRWVRRGGRWWEVGVRWEDPIGFQHVPLEADPPAWLLEDRFLAEAAEGYVLDAPRKARILCEQLTRCHWRGVFVAFDYGLSWSQLTTERPAGTLRAYRKHAQTAELLDCPGEQDLTAHVCWDWLIDALHGADFRSVALRSQERFFVEEGGKWLEEAFARSSGEPSHRAETRRLQELLHPARLGQKFQVLSGMR